MQQLPQGGYMETVHMQGPSQQQPFDGGYGGGGYHPQMMMQQKPMVQQQMGGYPMMDMHMDMGGGNMYGQQQQMMGGGQESDVFVEVTPELQPNFGRGPNDTFIMQLPPILVRITTHCQPPPPSVPGLAAYKPADQFTMQIPELQHVVFDPRSRSPPDGSVCVRTVKRGAVLEVPPSVGLNAQLKANSPHGTMVLEDIQVMGGTMKQKVGENSLHYKLQVEGQLTMAERAGNNGANRLQVELVFTFVAKIQLGSGGQEAAGAGGQPMMMHMQMQQPIYG